MWSQKTEVNVRLNVMWSHKALHGDQVIKSCTSNGLLVKSRMDTQMSTSSVCDIIFIGHIYFTSLLLFPVGLWGHDKDQLVRNNKPNTHSTTSHISTATGRLGFYSFFAPEDPNFLNRRQQMAELLIIPIFLLTAKTKESHSGSYMKPL